MKILLKACLLLNTNLLSDYYISHLNISQFEKMARNIY